MIYITFFILFFSFTSSLHIHPCPYPYRRTKDCKNGEKKSFLNSTELSHSECFICEPLKCQDGYSTEISGCPFGKVISQEGWSSGLPCVKCIDRKCQFGTDEIVNCKIGYSKTMVYSINNLNCFSCEKNSCPCGSSLTMINCPKGFSLEDVEGEKGLSGNDRCKRCIKNVCPEGWSTCPKCSRGFEVVKNGMMSGFEECARCEEIKCADNDHRVKFSKVKQFLEKWEKKGYDFVINGYSGIEHVCIHFFPVKCPTGYSINTVCESKLGFETLEFGISENKKCKKCTQVLCPKGFSTDVVCSSSGYTEVYDGYSSGEPCVKCIPKSCPKGFSTLVNNDNCDQSKGYKIIQSPIFEGELKCNKCEIRNCPPKTSTSIEKCSINDQGYTIHKTTSWSDGKICKECLKKQCPDNLLPENDEKISNCPISKGWKINYYEFYSGEARCSECVPEDCSYPFTLGNKECLGDGFEKIQKLSGGKNCVWCKEKQCPKDYQFYGDVKCDSKRGEGYTEEYHKTAKHGHDNCFRCIPLDCQFGFSTEKMENEKGWRIVKNGYSGDLPCIKYMPIECPKESFVDERKCNHGNENGWELKENGHYSRGKKCFECKEKECPSKLVKDEKDCSIIGYNMIKTEHYSGDKMCHECIPKKCPTGFSTVIENEDKCIEERGYEIIFSGAFSGNNECKKCSSLECPANSHILNKCDKRGFKEVIVGKSEGKNCIECIPKDCPKETYLRDKLTKKEQRGYDWIPRENVFSGHNECGVYIKKECPEGYDLELKGEECKDARFELGWVINIGGYSGREKCKKCVKKDCPNYWVTEENIKCDVEMGYSIVEHETSMSGYSRCVRCRPKKCEEGYSTGIICSSGFETKISGFSGGSECVKCVKRECDCNYSTFVTCPSHMEKECNGYSGIDECCRCI